MCQKRHTKSLLFEQSTVSATSWISYAFTSYAAYVYLVLDCTVLPLITIILLLCAVTIVHNIQKQGSIFTKVLPYVLKRAWDSVWIPL